ncbi:MAG: AMP-binding protein [Microbacteriaceae bacterium]
MTRSLHRVDAADPVALMAALRVALTGDGPAVLPMPAVPAGTTHPAGAVGGELPQRVAVVIETSGSTGSPKRVAISTDALLASAAASAGALGGQGQWLLALPAHYIAGTQVLVRSIAAATEPVILPGGHFDPAAFATLAGVMTADLRFVSLVPAQLTRLLDAAPADAGILPALRRFDGILVGGQAMPGALVARARAADLHVRRTYGSSETCGGCVYDGVPIGDTRARIAEDGVLELAGSVLAEGYLRDPGRTAAAFRSDAAGRWYRTGDLASIADGTVAVTGRADHVIISGGEKVLLDAVEDAVRALPGMAEAVVVVAEHEVWGQVPVILLDHDPSVSLEFVRARIAARLGRAAAPDRIVQIERMPLLASGKPDRLRLADLARR